VLLLVVVMAAVQVPGVELQDQLLQTQALLSLWIAPGGVTEAGLLLGPGVAAAAAAVLPSPPHHPIAALSAAARLVVWWWSPRQRKGAPGQVPTAL